MDRRDFIKLTAITGTSATLASCGNPENQLIRFIPDDDVVPGVAEWKPSICPMCAAGCGLTVRVMSADVDTVRNGQAGVVTLAVAKKLEGQPDHPINRGSLCARGQASIQVTYHPDRLMQPLKRKGARGSGEFEPIAWEAAIAELVARLDALAAEGNHKALTYLTRPAGGRRLAHAAELLDRFGAPPPLAFEVFGNDVVRRANQLSFGHELLPTLDFARSRYVIGFGADFLGTWNSPVAQSIAYGDMRQGHPQTRGKFVQVEPRMSLTGANADEWLPAQPGTEGIVALGLAHVLMANQLRPAAAAQREGALVAGWSGGLGEYTPQRVEQITGVPAKRIDRIARELAQFAPAVAVVGGAPLAQTNGLFTAVAVNALNALLGAVEQPGGLFFAQRGLPQGGVWFDRPEAGQPANGSHQATVGRLRATKLLLIDAANPVYGMPAALRVRDALAAIPFIASFGSFLDDTSVFADLILPDHSFLETWVDSMPESGALQTAASTAGPVMKPLHQTRATVEVLTEVAGKLKTPLALTWKSAEEVAKSMPMERARSAPEVGAKGPFTYADPTFDGDPQQFPFHFLPYESPAFGDGSAAHLPWLQELPDALTSAMWSSWVEINPQTALRIGVVDGDLLEIASAHGSLRAPAVIFPGIAPDLVAMPVGQGHEVFTRYASKRGANPLAILAPAIEPETGALAWAATRVKVTRVGRPDGSLIMYAGEMREHPHEHQR